MTISPVLERSTQQIHAFPLNDKILKGFDGGVLTGMILIYLQKAFDLINLDIFSGS